MCVYDVILMSLVQNNAHICIVYCYYFYHIYYLYIICVQLIRIRFKTSVDCNNIILQYSVRVQLSTDKRMQRGRIGRNLHRTFSKFPAPKVSHFIQKCILNKIHCYNIIYMLAIISIYRHL